MKIALISFLVNSITIRSLAAYVKSNGYEALCIFCPVPFNEQNTNELIALFRKEQVDLAGVSLVTDDFYSAVTITKAIKKDLDIPVVWGGAHVNVMPEESLKFADMVCRGEGEEALLELMRKLDSREDPSQVRNFWFKKDSGFLRNELRHLQEDLDVFPFPDNQIDTQYVLNEKGLQHPDVRSLKKEYSVMTSRGCPYRCDYCYNNYRFRDYQGKGTYVRMRSIDNVIAELEQAKARYGQIERVNFWDDSFLVRRMDEFVRFKQLYKEKVNIPFFILAEPMTFDQEKMRLLKESGLHQIQIGVQTGSERLNHEVYHRQITNEKVLAVAENIHSLGINVKYDLIFNNPYESKEEIKETVRLLLKFPKPFSLQGYNLIFYPGTEITRRALADGFISPKAEGDDFSTIQSNQNTPLETRDSNVVSKRFYTINYDAKDKEYLNSVFQIVNARFIPKAVFGFFLGKEHPLKRFALFFLIAAYRLLVRIRNSYVVQ